ncbi:MAG TPA: hypothetical protein VGM54_17055 [Chthoniobacter sp.]|jgi:hypothetical protein
MFSRRNVIGPVLGAILVVALTGDPCRGADLSPEIREAAAVEALGQHFAEDPVQVRMAILLALGGRTSGESMFPSKVIGPQDLHAEFLPRQDSATEILLISALGDTEVRRGMTVAWTDFQVTDPRVCDTAAYLLSRLWPTKYVFDGTDAPAGRDRQIQRIQKVSFPDRKELLKPR